MSKNWICSWQWKSSRTRQWHCRSESFAMKTGIPTNGINGQKPHLIENGIRIVCNTENFVPIVVPGLSSSSLASSSSSRTPVKQESHSPSSSSSPSSPTISEMSVSRKGRCTWQWHLSSTSVWVGWWKIRETWGNPSQQNKNQSKRDHHRTEKPVWWSWDSGMAARIQGKFGGWWNSITGRLSCQFFSWRFFRADYKETWGFG